MDKDLLKTHNINIWVASKTTDKGNTIFIPCGRTIPDTIKKGLAVDIIQYKAFDDWDDAYEFAKQEAYNFLKLKHNG